MQYILNPEEALEQYADMVYKIAYVQTKQKSDAEDIFQEVFLRLVRYKHKIHDGEHLKAWLIKVTISQCKRHFMNPWKRKVVSLSDENIREEVCGLEEEGTVLEAVKSLPNDYCRVLHLFYYEQFSVKEISGILHISESLVKTRLSRGRQKLKILLKGENCNEGAVY